MTLRAPADLGFYSDLIAVGARTGTKPEDALFAWSDASNLRTDLAGPARTFAALPEGLMVPSFASAKTWAEFPEMTAREQLPYVQAASLGPARKLAGGRDLDAFETYLATLAPALLRPDGRYCASTPLYAGSSYPENWTLDNFPAGLLAYRKWATEAASHGQDTSIRAAYSACCPDLIARSILKGYVSLGDLRSFAKRVAPGRDVVYSDALKNLDAVRAALGLPLGAAALDFDRSLIPGAKPDARVPSPEDARGMAPTAFSSRTIALDARWALGLGLGLGILGTGLWLHKRAQ